MGLHQWREIKDEFDSGLLLGNGASIAIDKSFGYTSILECANKIGRIPKSVSNIFSYFGTTDFELILRMLLYASDINRYLNISDTETMRIYGQLKSALIKAVHSVHPSYAKVEKHLEPAANFLRGFRTVVSLNYDLCVYWAILAGNDKWGHTWFKDCFIGDGHTFEENWARLRDPWPPATGATLVFYPHGNLAIVTDLLGREYKQSADEYATLLGKLDYEEDRGRCVPLFVSEGTSAQKRAAIRRSPYLSNVYDNVLKKIGQSVVIYGWSMSECDNHILDAVLNCGNLTKIAVSVIQCAGWEDKCHDIDIKIRTKTSGCGKRVDLVFFDADSEGCWIHPSSSDSLVEQMPARRPQRRVSGQANRRLRPDGLR